LNLKEVFKSIPDQIRSDVVFNGSRTRKPVDQASIELVFAQFPENSEISVKWQLSRSGK
jgi:chromosome segregation ATPase